MSTTEELVAHAVAYAAAGFPVVPLHSPNGSGCDCHRADCASPAKHPRTAHGLSDASTDAATIRKWWATWPEANVGVVLPAEYVVVDVDVEQASAALDGRELPTTATARTGRGWQFLYRAEQPVRPAVGIVEHVDIRGLGSYVVAPPSRHVNGATYVWVIPPKDGIVDAPAWVYEVGRPARVEPTAPGEPIPAGRRNAELTRLAGAMRHHGMTGEEMTAALLVVNARCDPPLSEDEVRTIARSVGRYEPGERGPRIVIGKEPKRALVAVPRSDIEPREAHELRLGRWDEDARQVPAECLDSRTPLVLRMAFVVEEKHDLALVIHPDTAIWDCADEVVEIIATLGATWVFVDSIAYACLGMEVEKSVTATRYSAAIVKLPCPVVSLAHTTKAEADPKHPFGSVFWSNGARITAGMSAPDDTKRVLKNRKTNQRAPFPPVEIDWSWSETEVLPPRLVERRAVLTLADRAWDVLAGGPLTSEPLLDAVNGDGGKPTTLGTLKVMLSRSPRFESTPSGWRRAPVKGGVTLKIGANGSSLEKPNVGDNRPANDPANAEREGANETANGATTFDERFAEQQTAAWSSLAKDGTA